MIHSLALVDLLVLGRSRSCRAHQVPHHEEAAEQEHETSIENQSKSRVEPVHVLAGHAGDHSSQTEEHLDDLKSGKGLCQKAHAVATAVHKVIAIHNKMNQIVHGREKVSHSIEVELKHALIPSEQERDDVVIIMKEDDGLLSDDQQQSVHELESLAHDEHDNKLAGDSHLVGPLFSTTDESVPTIVVPGVGSDRDGVDGTGQTEDAHEKIPNFEMDVHVVGLTVLHELDSKIHGRKIENRREREEPPVALKPLYTRNPVIHMRVGICVVKA